MKHKKAMLATGAGVIAAALALFFLRRTEQTAPETQKHSAEKTQEALFLSEWSALLAEHACVFCGLYSGLLRVRNQTAKKPEKALREWCQRTFYKWENSPAELLCRQCIVPLIESRDREGLAKWAALLLRAAEAAGITPVTAQTLVLTEHNAADFVEWEGFDLYPGDLIEIITPAWYQAGTLLEQGQCRRLAEGAE